MKPWGESGRARRRAT